jgi:hypothetical protein
MTRRAIIRRRDYHARSSGGHTRGGSADALSDARYSRFRQPPLLREEIDQTLGRWWRATRIVRRLNTAKS